MRHRTTTHSFGRRSGPRKALLRGLVYSLVEHGRIKTTVAKAKELRRHVEKAITLGKKGSVHARRLLLARFPNPGAVSTIVDDLSPRFMDRMGGYTRIIKTGARPGDRAEMAFIEFVDYKLPATEAEADAPKRKTAASKAKKPAPGKKAKVTKKAKTVKSKAKKTS